MSLMTRTLLFALVIICCSIPLSTAAYNEKDAIEYAWASTLAYCGQSSISLWTCGGACQTLTGYQTYFSKQFDISKQESLAFSLIVNPTKKRFITTFRGSIGTMQLIQQALQRKGIPYNLTDIPEALVDEYFYNNYVTYLRSNFTTQIKAAFAKYPDFKFVFTGHSLGAAFSVLAAFDAINEGLIPGDQVVIYNYGMPRLGNFIFAQAIQESVKELYRVVHWKDTVPHLPFCMKDEAGNCVKIAEEAVKSGLPGEWPAWHVSQEIFYSINFSVFAACGGEGEDPKCSNQFSLTQTNIPNHLYYFGVFMDCPKAKQEHFLQF